MGNIAGWAVRDNNPVLKFLMVFFVGFLGLAYVLSWRSLELFAAEYNEMPKTNIQIKIEKENQIKKQSAVQWNLNQ